MFKKISKVTLALTLSLGLVGCTQNTTPAPTEAPKGSAYEVKGSGYGGEMTFNVTIDAGKITGIEVVNHNETEVVFDRALPVITQRIIDANSPEVDSVTAATFSSYGVKVAVADAMKQAGLEVAEVTMATSAPKKEATTLADVSADIVVVGGGPAGLAAAIGAKQKSPNLNVILVEKLDILSGNGKFDMNYFDLINSEAQKAAKNEEWTVNQVENFIKAKETTGETPERLAVWANASNEHDAWLRSIGVELDYNYGGTNHMAKEDQYSGEVVQAGLEKAAKDVGVDIRTGTKGLDLIMDGQTVVGVNVSNNNNETYAIKAGAVIVATGGFSHNKEMLAEYAPGAEALATSNQMGATGDFVKVFEANGMKMEAMDKLSVFSNIVVPRRDLTGGADLHIIVNKEGNRFMSESASGLERGNTMLAQTDKAAFYITDKTGYDSFYRIRKHVKLGYYAEGATMAELAEKLGVDAAGLEASVAAFNEAQVAGTEDTLTGKVAKRPIDAAGPYYGVRVETAIHMTKGGVAANEKAEVLFTDGSVVSGLYAAGEVTSQTGAYSSSVVFGKIAGENAAAALAK